MEHIDSAAFREFVWDFSTLRPPTETNNIGNSCGIGLSEFCRKTPLFSYRNQNQREETLG